MSRTQRALTKPRLVAALSLLALILLASADSARGSISPTSQLTLSNNDPNGQGTSTFTVFYGLPQSVQVGSNFTLPVKLYVDNLTRLMNFLNSYNVTVLLSLSNGKQVSGTVGISGNAAAENLGALQLHEGQAWGPINITLPLTQANTGLSNGQEALANATIRVNADVYFNQPVNTFRPEQNQTLAGYTVVANGIPAGVAPNYSGLALLGIGVVLVAVSVATRRRRQSSATGEAAKAPGAV